MAKLKSLIRIAVVLSISLPIILGEFTRAQSPETMLNDPEFARTVRTQFVQSALLPDGVAFHSIMRLAKYMQASDDPEDAAGWVQSEMGFSDGLSSDFVDSLLAALNTLEAEIQAATRTMACLGPTPIKAGEDIYSLFEEMDDMRDDLAESSFDAFVGELDAKSAAAFQRWVDRQKLNVTHVKFKHKEHYESQGASADASLASMCVHMDKEFRGIKQ